MAVDDEAGRIEAILEATRQRIREDASREPVQWRSFFDEIEHRVFDTDFHLSEVRDEHGLKTAASNQAFKTSYGSRPLAYLRQLRVETAQTLRNLGTLPVWQIARLTGFESAQTLRAAERRQERHMADAGEKAPEPSTERRPPRSHRDASPAVDLRQLFGVAASLTDAQRHHDGLEREATLQDLRGREQRWAQPWWEGVRLLATDEQREEIAAAPFETPALFEHLCEKSREEGRDDRRRAIVIAELALTALEPLAKHTTEPEHSHHQAKAWACLGNARWRALDDQGAEQAFGAAERFLASIEPPPELRAELLFYRGCHRFAQRRLNEALDLVEAALALVEHRSAGRLVAEILILRAQIFTHLGQPARALPDLRTALATLEPASEPYITWVAHQNLASTYWRLGLPEEAEKWLRSARPRAAALGRSSSWCHTLWLEGLIADQQGHPETAAARLCEACEGLRSIREWGYFAVAALDLAKVEARRGESGEAVSWATQALPHLEALQLESEGLAALALLRQEVTAKQLSTAVLERLRRAAGRAVNAPPLQETSGEVSS